MGTRPFDDDEDPTPRAAPPKRPASGAAKPAGPPEPSGPKRLAWGFTGNVNFAGELSDQTGREGVIRLVGTGISYKAPPLDRFVWQAALEQPGRYEMAWSEGDPAQVQTLADLGAELRRGPPPTKQRLQHLDQVVQTLLQTTQVLHDNGRRLGLLHPGNVLLVPNSETGEVVLPDLGFIWTGKHGEPPWEDNPGRPAWLEKDLSRNRTSIYWDEEPARQQFSWPVDDLPVVPVESDLKTLARVFAVVLTGKAERTPTVPPHAADCWSVLKDVIKGEIRTAEQFQTRLAEKPLSLHWSAPKQAAATKKSNIPLLLLLLGLLLCGGPLGLLAYLYQAGLAPFAKSTTSTEPTAVASNSRATSRKTTPTPSSSPQTKTTSTAKKVEVDWKNKPAGKPPVSELDSLMSQFDATRDPKRRVELLTQMYGLYGRSDEREQKGMAPFIEWARGVYVNDWVKRYHNADESLRKLVTRLEGAKTINDLNNELAGLRQKSEPISPSLNERETQCLEISGLRATELGSRH